MGGENIAGEPDQMIAVMGDIGDDGAGFGDTVSGPVGISGLQMLHRLPSGTTAARGGLLLLFEPFLDGGATVVDLPPGANAGGT